MKVRRKGSLRRQRIRSPDSGCARIAGAMHRPVNNLRLAPDVLHDVNFTAARPTDRGNVCSQHPERRPDALAKGNLETRFDPAISPRSLAERFQTRRGVFAAGIIFLPRLNHEMPVL